MNLHLMLMLLVVVVVVCGEMSLLVLRWLTHLAGIRQRGRKMSMKRTLKMTVKLDVHGQKKRRKSRVISCRGTEGCRGSRDVLLLLLLLEGEGTGAAVQAGRGGAGC
jgi:hypothetical protein